LGWVLLRARAVDALVRSQAGSVPRGGALARSKRLAAVCEARSV
jgi:hypothetical protein